MKPWEGKNFTWEFNYCRGLSLDTEQVLCRIRKALEKDWEVLMETEPRLEKDGKGGYVVMPPLKSTISDKNNKVNENFSKKTIYYEWEGKIVKSWNKPENKPEQGKKILCMNKGDFYVAQRWGDYWFSIPFNDSQYSYCFAPELWQDINFPIGLTGKMLVSVEGKFMDIDSLQLNHPEVYGEMLLNLITSFMEGQIERGLGRRCRKGKDS